MRAGWHESIHVFYVSCENQPNKALCMLITLENTSDRVKLGMAGLRLGAWQIFGMLHAGNDNEHGSVTTATTTNTSTSSSNI